MNLLGTYSENYYKEGYQYLAEQLQIIHDNYDGNVDNLFSQLMDLVVKQGVRGFSKAFTFNIDNDKKEIVFRIQVKFPTGIAEITANYKNDDINLYLTPHDKKYDILNKE